mgnify:CR=1 FL=1
MDPTTRELQRIRKLRKWLIPAVAALITSVFIFYTVPWPAAVRETIVLTSVAVYSVSALLVVFARCPRCGHLFHNVLGFNNPLSRCCSHCGLKLDDETH